MFQYQKQRNEVETKRNVLSRLELCIVVTRNLVAVNWLKLNDVESKPNLSMVKTHSIAAGEHQIQRSSKVRNTGAIRYQIPKWRWGYQPMSGSLASSFTISKISRYLIKERMQTSSLVPILSDLGCISLYMVILFRVRWSTSCKSFFVHSNIPTPYMITNKDHMHVLMALNKLPDVSLEFSSFATFCSLFLLLCLSHFLMHWCHSFNFG